MPCCVFRCTGAQTGGTVFVPIGLPTKELVSSGFSCVSLAAFLYFGPHVQHVTLGCAHVQVFVRPVINAAVDVGCFLSRSPAVYFTHLGIVTGPSGVLFGSSTS